ncbi:Hypothetical protein conserved in the Yarrowia clade [Yarrowia lipolytica]|nr:Hypothetical protein YALI2_B00353g [Yarrowia lipolytica]VBB89769.1 Hypothetical protein conserved in the Yarrowia clade [Yarrowia lipolytica]
MQHEPSTPPVITMTLPNPSLADLEHEMGSPRSKNPSRRYITSDTRSVSLSSLPFDDRYLKEHFVDGEKPQLPLVPMPSVAPEALAFDSKSLSTHGLHIKSLSAREFQTKSQSANEFQTKPLSPPSNPQSPLSKVKPVFKPIGSPTSQSSLGLQPLSEIVYIDLYNLPQAKKHVEQTGRLPQWLQECRSLQYLMAPKMGLKVIDAWVSSSLVNLKVLDIRSNNITIFPDHLARLSDSLLVVNLDDNPCLDKWMKRNKQFAERFNAAIARALALPKKKAPNSYSTRLVGTTSSSSESEQHQQQSRTSKNIFKSFRKKRHSTFNLETLSPPSSDDDDDFLTSLTPDPPIGNTFSSASMASAGSSQGSRTYCDSVESAGSSASMVKPVDIAKTNVLIDLFRDIWESTTLDLLPDIREPISVYSQELNPTNTSLIQFGTAEISRQKVLDLYEQLVNLEFTYVQHMTELCDIYVNASGKGKPQAAKATFRDLLPLHKIHKDTMFPDIEKAYTRYLNKKDSNFEPLLKVFKKKESIYAFYSSFGSNYPTIYARVLKWEENFAYLKEAKPMSSINAVSFGSMGVGRPVTVNEAKNQKAAKRETVAQVTAASYMCADWMKICQKRPNHSMARLSDYMRLPRQHIQEVKELLTQMSRFGDPFLTECAELWTKFVADLDIVVKKAEGNYLLYCFQRDYGHSAPIIEPHRTYEFDFLAVLEKKTLFESAKHKGEGDAVVYNHYATRIKNLDQGFKYASPTSSVVDSLQVKQLYAGDDMLSHHCATHLRLVICNDSIIILDEKTRHTVHSVPRNQVKATAVWDRSTLMFDELGIDEEPLATLIPTAKIRLVFLKSRDVWHLELGSIYGLKKKRPQDVADVINGDKTLIIPTPTA